MGSVAAASMRQPKASFMRKLLLVLIAAAIVGGGAFAYQRYRKTPPQLSITTAVVTRGDLAESVGATGTLQAVTSVQVGTQVSGTVMELRADFNSLVKKGQVIARLEPSLFETQIEQATANLVRAQADVERLKVALDDSRTKLARARELSNQQLIPQNELDTAEVTVRSAEAQLRSAAASVTQAEASLNQSKVNLDHSIITAPIDGLVISRNVDVGQTVAASMNAPTLFVLAADLTKMQVLANLDESDVGRIRPGQQVSFGVDAYPAERFAGKVAQVRLQPIVQQNVVTYATVIDVSNPELKLKPGMTANVTIEIARRSNVVRIPNAAIRFRPTPEIFAALGQTPDGAPRGEGERIVKENGENGGGPSSARSGGPGGASEAPSAGRAGGEGRQRGQFDEAARGRLLARMQSMSPEERQQMMERMRARGFDPTGGAASAPAAKPAAPSPGMAARAAKATTVDALFGPLQKVETRGRVWLNVEKKLKPVPLVLGITDGQMTELIEGELDAGTEVVTNVLTGNETTRTAFNPFGGPFPFMGPGGGRGGSGGGGGTGRGR
jgi:HlyD family secretion protein